MQSNRNVNIDLLRIISALFIVFIHVTPDFSPDNNGTLPSLFINPLVKSGLTIFFIMSGYFVLNGKEESVLSFYRKRAVSTLIPFVVFSFMHYTYFHQWDVNPYGFQWFLNYVKAMLIGAPANFGREYFMSGLYWFVYAIIGVYLMSPLFRKAISFINEENALKALSILVLFYVVYYTLSMSSPVSGISENILQLPESSKWVFYFVTGGIIFRVKKTFNFKFLILFSFIFYLLVMLTYRGMFDGAWYSKSWVDANPAMFLLSISLFMAFRSLKIKSNGKLITYFASLTYGTYLIHITMLSFISELSRGIFNNYLLNIVATSTSVFVSSMIVAALVNKIIVDRLIRLLR